jgi:hypothetical protein
MLGLLRELAVTVAAAACVAGPVAAIVVPLTPPAWRGAPLVWAILLGAVVLVARLRGRHRGRRQAGRG